jgi:hypothetical protein
MPGENILHQRVNGSAVTGIERHGRRASFGGYGFKFFDITTGKNEAATARGQFVCDGGTDAARAANNQHHGRIFIAHKSNDKLVTNASGIKVAHVRFPVVRLRARRQKIKVAAARR